MGRDFVAVFSDTILDNYLHWWIPEPPNKNSVENGHDFRHFLCIKTDKYDIKLLYQVIVSETFFLFRVNIQ